MNGIYHIIEKGRIVQEGTHHEWKDVPGLYADFLVSREAMVLLWLGA